MYENPSDWSDKMKEEQIRQAGTKPGLVVLTGPTAVGKTALSIRLAKAVGGEIISADSMQVYRSMDIGSAKIRPEETEGIPHHLIDILDPDESFDVVRFQSMAKDAAEKIRAAGHIPIVTGGTGFYIQALLYDIDFTENDADRSFRSGLEAIAGTEGGPALLHRMLEEADPESAGLIHENNIKRTIRALEFHRQTGQKISVHNALEKARMSPYNFAYVVIMVKDTILERKQPRFTETRKRGRTVSPSSCLLVARYILFHFIIYAPVPVRLVVIKCCFISAHFKHHLYVCGSDTASTVCYDPVGLVYTLSLKHCCYLIICL